VAVVRVLADPRNAASPWSACGVEAASGPCREVLAALIPDLSVGGPGPACAPHQSHPHGWSGLMTCSLGRPQPTKDPLKHTTHIHTHTQPTQTLMF
jgi:hypothetical protein